MFRGLVISAVCALGIAVGCSQQDGTSATLVPDTAAPPVADDSSAVQPRARQFPRQGRGFVPLDNPTFLAAHETKYFGDEELVLGVEFAGEVRAYPVRMLRYHHVVNDTVGGEPLLVTY